MSDKLIYFMRPVGHVGPIKIGCSKEPEGRLAAMAIVSPLRLEIVATCPGTHADERRLHGMFAKDWTHHEWFGASKQLLALVGYVERHGELPELPAGEIVRLPRKQCGPGTGGSRGPSRKMVEFGALVRPEFEAGASATLIASRHGCATNKVCKGLRAVGIQLSRGRRQGQGCGVADVVRAEEFERRYQGGETLQEIGDAYGITRERVRQILRKTGVESLGQRPGVGKRIPAPLTDAEKEAVRLYCDGTRPGLIMEQTGLDRSRILRALNLSGVEVKAQGFWNRRPDDAEITARVAELYLAGVKTSDISRLVPEIGAAPRIYSYLRKAGVDTRNPGRHRSRSWVSTKEAGERTRVEILSLHRAGRKSSEIAAEVGVTINTVYRHLGAAGIKLRQAA